MDFHGDILSITIYYHFFLLPPLVIESDPCCFQVSIACEPEKPEDEDCKGNILFSKLHSSVGVNILLSLW